MNTQPIDPRALKAAEEIFNQKLPLRWTSRAQQEEVARIIQSHFAESVNGKLLEAAKALIGGKWNHLCSDGIGGCNAISEALLSNLEEAISLAQSQPPSMADELAEALRKLMKAQGAADRARSVSVRSVVEEFDYALSEAQAECDALLRKHDAQKGQS